MRLAEDFNGQVLDAFHTVVREITAHVGMEPRLQFMPRWVNTDMGDTRRTSVRWFLPVEGVLTNCGLSVDEYGRGPVGGAPEVARRWTVAASRHRGPVLCQEILLSTPPGVGLLRHVASSIELLPYHPAPQWVDVTPLERERPQYVEGAPAHRTELYLVRDVDAYGDEPGRRRY